MRLLLFVALLLSVAACRTSAVGACAADGDCKAGSICDRTQDTPVCVVPQNGCFPACPAGNVCRAGACISAECSPACDSAHVCDLSSATCVPALTAQVLVTSPAADAFATGTLQATASAAAPGGVTALRFELRRGGTVLATAAGTNAPTAADPTNWAATLPLAGKSDGPAQLVAIATYPTGTSASAPVAILIDQTAPVIAMVTDGRSAVVAGGTTAQVSASVSDGAAGSGVLASSVKLVVGGAATSGVAAGGNFIFAVPLTDALAAAGTSATAAFRIDAKDRAGNSTSLSGDPKEVLRIDRDAPAISAIGIVTPADYTSPDGRAYYAEGSVPLSVSATIKDGAGIEAASTCLRITGETGACAHAGTQAPGSDTWAFSLPRPPVTSPTDGSTPLAFTIAADDTLAKALTGALRAEHHADSPAQPVYFDNAPPSVAVAADPTPYARTLPDGGPNVLNVTATIFDPSGLASPPQLVSAGANTGPVSSDGGFFVFQLSATDAPAGAEGQYAFAVQAQDNLGHVASVAAARFIDDAPPAAAISVFKDTDPLRTGVTYPAPQANTGHTGASFIYSDTVHVKGTLTDQSGLSGATVHVDGLELDGGVSAGVPRTLGCGPRATSCAFDLTLPLNAAGNGAFHTGILTVPFGPSAIPSAVLSVVVEAQDDAVAFDGTAAHNSQSAPQAARATRFLFQTTLGGPVSGLAVHPSGRVIATTNNGTDTVYALAPDSPAIAWSYGAGVSLGPIQGPLAIGAGDATSASIYVATAGQTVLALSPAGTPVWRADNLDPFSTGPAIASVGAGEEAIVASSGTATLWAVRDGGVSASVVTGGVDTSSSPVVFDGGVYFGTATTVSGHLLQADGTLGAAVSDTNPTGPFFDLISDGKRIYAATRGGGSSKVLLQLDQGLRELKSIAVQSSAQPTINIAGHLVLPDTGGKLYEIVPGSSALPAAFYNTGPVARVPLQGSDGRTYYPSTQGRVFALEGAQLSWVFDPPNNIFRGATMDCAGRLFVASGSVVYALITDDHGLADTPWPAYRRDGRNSGNAGAPKYGIRTATGCAQ